jgi:hypothetical protein
MGLDPSLRGNLGVQAEVMGQDPSYGAADNCLLVNRTCDKGVCEGDHCPSPEVE